MESRPWAVRAQVLAAGPPGSPFFQVFSLSPVATECTPRGPPPARTVAAREIAEERNPVCCLLPLRFKLLCKASLQPLLHAETYVPHPPSSEPCAQLSQRETFPDSPQLFTATGPWHMLFSLPRRCSFHYQQILHNLQKPLITSTVQVTLPARPPWQVRTHLPRGPAELAATPRPLLQALRTWQTPAAASSSATPHTVSTWLLSPAFQGSPGEQTATSSFTSHLASFLLNFVPLDMFPSAPLWSRNYVLFFRSLTCPVPGERL